MDGGATGVMRVGVSLTEVSQKVLSHGNQLTAWL